LEQVAKVGLRPAYAGRRLYGDNFFEPSLDDNGALFSDHEQVTGVL
jgi:hypothetical protein